MVDFTNDILELRRRFNTFVYGPNVPEIARDRLQSIPGTDADMITEGAEILYAHRDLLDDQGLDVMAALFGYAHNQGWSQFCKDDRCRKIVDGARGDLGEIQRPRLIENDPEPQIRRRSDGIDSRTGEPSVIEPPAQEAPKP